MKKLLYILSLLLLLGCSKDEDTRIFTVTVNAIPPEGGTVTLGTSQVTTNEYKYGDTANANAVVSDGYFFSHWSANTFILFQRINFYYLFVGGGGGGIFHSSSLKSNSILPNLIMKSISVIFL